MFSAIRKEEYRDILMQEGTGFQKLFPKFEEMVIAHCMSGILT